MTGFVFQGHMDFGCQLQILGFEYKCVDCDLNDFFK